MKHAIVVAVLARGNFRCAFCACDLAKPARTSDAPTVCKLDLSESDSSLVASCVACNAEFVRWWGYRAPWSIEAARRILGRHNGLAVSGPFVDYLELCVPAKLGIRTPFAMALARIEAQRNQELDLVASRRLTGKVAA